MGLRKCRIPQIQIVWSGLFIAEDAHRPIGLEKVRFYINGNNSFTIDKMKIFDPEMTGGIMDIYTAYIRFRGKT